MKNFLHIEDLYKQYGNKVILDNIDLSVKKGEICTLVGPSGCGKSTLLRIILGQELQSRGDISIDGKDVGFASSDRGIVYQRYSLFPHLSVLENVMLGHTLEDGFFERRKNRKKYEKEAMFYLEKVRLGEHAHKYPHELSGGMQQRAAIAQALLKKPKILLMDEPFGALDPDTREDMQLFLLELWEENPMTIFFVTHDLEEALFVGSRLLVLSQYYMDDRGKQAKDRGAKIVGDYLLDANVKSTDFKQSQEFKKLVKKIRSSGFDPENEQHVRDFNLNHPDSYQTLEDYEDSSQ